MKKIVIGIVVLVLLGAGYIFAKDVQIKKELEKVERSEFTESTGEQNMNNVDSQITATRSNGEWSVSETGDYTLDPASLKLEFTGYKPGGQHTGTFQNGTVSVALDAEGNPVSSKIVLDVASVKTDTAAVDTHLQDGVFFDAANHPQIEVNIQGIERESDTSVKAITQITMAGDTKTLAIPVTLTEVDGGVKFDVDTKIKISEYGIAYGPVQDDVRIVASGVLKKK